jgi:hypothetical protein
MMRIVHAVCGRYERRLEFSERITLGASRTTLDAACIILDASHAKRLARSSARSGGRAFRAFRISMTFTFPIFCMRICGS